ncbi:pleiotropic drug resistance protein, ABC superfamily [Calycina marina]|uniref:Pleiotropic drug resistance protein, ABC superfamily n=1 Tax=Calycina marina TaxID=1763456 RepID=A0A9P7YZS9_9HELO|nr:pleiotropic drug resistance protein, ABC superfamily [Calycina marina]
MPALVAYNSLRKSASILPHEDRAEDRSCHVELELDTKKSLADLHKALTREPRDHYPEAHQAYENFLHNENESTYTSRRRLGVCFKDVSTWVSIDSGYTPIKTLKDALWRTLSGQDIYEWTFAKLKRQPRPETGRALIQRFSGVVRSGEILLVLGQPGSGCSTFLRTIANDHTSFLGVTGSLDYSGLTPEEISRQYRGEVSYIPEDDVHFPTLTVRQTLEFALQSKTPKRHRKEIPRYHEILARVFGISHVLDTLVGNEYIRGVSGGERKRISIVESLAADSSVVAWDNSTRGLDAVSALDYARSLRILTDTCGKATIVSLYQASDAVFSLSDKLLLIDKGRMIFQGPSHLAKPYFESLGYECQDRQTISDFLSSVASVSERRFKDGWEHRTPKGAEELEKTFLASSHWVSLQTEIQEYEREFSIQSKGNSKAEISLDLNNDSFKLAANASKSRYAPESSSYTISYLRQILLCAKRQWWQLQGHPEPLFVKSISTIVNAFLIGSMFYAQPIDSDGAFSRGGCMFYSTILIGWIQLAELEDAFLGRDIISRQKRFAFVTPSAVSFARVLIDLGVVLVQALLYSIIAYFLAGFQRLSGNFFTFVLFIYVISVCMTAQYRFIGALSPNYEVAIRYCGVLLLLYIVFGGYFLSLQDLSSQVPWFGWVTYLLPITYTYEAMMTTEFHGLSLPCTPASLIPGGTDFSDPAYQTCSIAGGFIGSAVVSGDTYLRETFGFEYSHVWRNLGILLLFTVVFIALAAWSTEVFDWDGEGRHAIEYKLSAKSRGAHFSSGRDVEEKAVQAQIPSALSNGCPNATPEDAVKLAASNSAFTWRDITYNIPYSGGERILLNKISAYCAPSTMTALIGASGAGKSTLLNALAQRQRSGQLTGEMLLNGRKLDASFQKRVGFCEQMDIHDESSTIREALEFSALLRQPKDTPRKEKLDYVDTILEILDLVEIQDYIIRCLPIEQKKRTTIGVELCAKGTDILFLDEPTSGLDGQGAMNILNLLKKLTQAGQAILCTIHQATQQQFTLFDNVLALNPGGNTFYFGGVGANGKEIFNYFGDHGVEVQEGKNVADFLIEVGVGILKSTTNPSLNFNDVWKSSSQAVAVSQTIQEICMQQITDGSSPAASSMSLSAFSASTWEQTIQLTKRVSRQYWRNPEYPYSRLYGSFLHAGLNGFTFFQLGNGIKDLQSKMFSCFLILMLVPEFMNATSMRFIANRDIWKSREYPSRIYGWVAFTAAQVVAELPYAIFGSILFFILFYFPVGLPLGVPAVYTFFMVVFFHLFVTSWGQWVGALSKDATIAANVMPFLAIMCELFNGVLRPHDQMPVIWRYTMYYVAPFTYWIGGVLSTVLSGRPVVCDAKDLNYFRPPSGQTCGEYAGSWAASSVGYLVDQNSTESCGYCQYSSANDYLVGIDLDSSKMWPYFCIFIGFVVSNFVLVFALMKVYTWWEFTRREKREALKTYTRE